MKRGNPDKGSVVHYMEEGQKNPICNNVLFHIYYTDYKPQVTCQVCRERLKS